MSDYDVIVLGAGPAGEVAAGRLGEGGLSVALVEPHLVGGECSYYACMPSKALLRPAQALAEARRHPGAREAITGELDAAAALVRRDEVIHDGDDSAQLPWLQDRGVTLVRGAGRLAGERRVAVGDDELTARRGVIVATGTAPGMPPIDGLADAKPWTNREATIAKEVPRRLAVLGGGVAGSELAQAWASLGSAVTLIEPQGRLLSQEEDFVGEQVLDALRAAGLDVRLSTSTERVTRSDGVVRLALAGGDAVEADELLVAAGRRPNTGDLGLDVVGLEPGEPIAVDDTMRSTAVDWLYAVGDVNGRQLLTHMGKHQARVAADVLLGRDAAVRDDGPPPRIVFTEPQVAAVGYTLAGAREAGIDARAVDVPTQSTAGASFVGRTGTPGTSRIVVDEAARTIVGATFTGPEVQDLLHAATIAVVAKVPVDDLWHAVPSFPTRSEIWLRLLESYGL